MNKKDSLKPTKEALIKEIKKASKELKEKENELKKLILKELEEFEKVLKKTPLNEHIVFIMDEWVDQEKRNIEFFELFWERDKGYRLRLSKLLEMNFTKDEPMYREYYDNGILKKEYGKYLNKKIDELDYKIYLLMAENIKRIYEILLQGINNNCLDLCGEIYSLKEVK